MFCSQLVSFLPPHHIETQFGSRLETASTSNASKEALDGILPSSAPALRAAITYIICQAGGEIKVRLPLSRGASNTSIVQQRMEAAGGGWVWAAAPRDPPLRASAA